MEITKKKVVQIIERGRTRRQIQENLTIKREGDQKYLILVSKQESSNVKAKKRGEEEEEEKFAKGMDFVWTLLDFSMVLSMETKSLCMVCMDGYGLV